MRDNELAGRVARLERTNRGLMMGMAVMAGAMGLMFLAGAGEKPADTIEAREFVVKDAQGRKRAVLGMSLFEPTLSLLDPKGAVRVSLGVHGEEPGLRLAGDEKNGDITMLITKGSGAAVMMKGITLSNVGDSIPSIAFKGHGGELMGGVDDNGVAGFVITSKGQRAVNVP